MQIDNEIRPGANCYISEAHALANLPSLLAPFNHPIIVTGTQSWAAFTANYDGDFTYPKYQYDGSASDEDAARIAAAEPTADVVIGIGGGRALDTAKDTAQQLHAEVILVPTLASNCAPYTPIGAIYHHDQHTFKRVAYFERSAYATVVDWQVMLTTPRAYFIAGIGDTLAKWYELDGIVETLDTPLPAFNRLAEVSALLIQETLVADAEPALADLAAQKITPAFINIVDAIIGLAGTIGGFGVHYGRIAGAHAIHNGLSYLPETQPILHGAKVAYGILVQLAYTNHTDEITNLLPLYQRLGLPTNLAALHVTDQSVAALTPVAAFASGPDESFRLIDPHVTADKILTAMQAVEKLTA